MMFSRTYFCCTPLICRFYEHSFTMTSLASSDCSILEIKIIKEIKLTILVPISISSCLQENINLIPREWFFWWVDYFGWIIYCFALTSSLFSFIWLLLFAYVSEFFSSRSLFTVILVFRFLTFVVVVVLVFFLVLTFSFFSPTTRAYYEKDRSCSKNTCFFATFKELYYCCHAGNSITNCS